MVGEGQRRVVGRCLGEGQHPVVEMKVLGEGSWEERRRLGARRRPGVGMRLGEGQLRLAVGRRLGAGGKLVVVT